MTDIESYGRDRIRDDLARIARGSTPLSVSRREILSSWQASLAAGLRPESLAVPFEGEVDPDDRLVRAARPATDRLAVDLAHTDASVVLSDARGRVVTRHSPSSRTDELDQLWLNPGYAWRLDTAGTTALGIATCSRLPVVVDGPEHFMHALSALTTASAPIQDTTTARLLGAVTLVCPDTAAHALLLPVAGQAAREIERRLVDAKTAPQRILHEEFLRARRHSRIPLAVVGDNTLLLNAPASRLFTSADQSRLWALAREALEEQLTDIALESSRDGAPLAATIAGLQSGDDLVGATLRVTVHNPQTNQRAGNNMGPHSRRSQFGWDSLTDTEQSLAYLIADGLTNKEAAARLIVSRHTIDSHLRHIFRKLEINSRVDLARIALMQRVASRAVA